MLWHQRGLCAASLLIAGCLLAGCGGGLLGGNQAPTINSLTATPGTVAPGGQSQIRCQASDPDGDRLSYQWWCSDGFFTGTGATVTWTAPNVAGNCQVRCTVDDGKGKATDSRQITVRVGTNDDDGSVVRRAVCVGISDYIGSGSDLRYCDKDAYDFGDALAASPAWNAANIAVIVNRQATAANIWAALNQMAAQSDADDQCVFFFSGHGGYQTDRPPYDEEDGYDEYLCETDLNQNITDDQLGDWVAGLPTSNVMIVLCSCFSGGFIKGPGAVKSIGPARTVGAGDGFAADLDRALKRRAKDIDDAGAGVVLTACDDDETCSEDYGHENDLFNYYVVQGMGGSADTNSDGRISAEEIYAWAAPRATQRSSDLPGVPVQHAQLWDANPSSPLVVLSDSGGGGGEFDPLGTWSVDGDVEMAWEPYSNVRLVFTAGTVKVYCYDSAYGEQLIFEGSYTRSGNTVSAANLPETNIGYGANNTISFQLSYAASPDRLTGTMTEFVRLQSGETRRVGAQIVAYYGIRQAVPVPAPQAPQPGVGKAR